MFVSNLGILTNIPKRPKSKDSNPASSLKKTRKKTQKTHNPQPSTAHDILKPYRWVPQTDPAPESSAVVPPGAWSARSHRLPHPADPPPWRTMGRLQPPWGEAQVYRTHPRDGEEHDKVGILPSTKETSANHGRGFNIIDLI